ncbi:hypothetical protein G6514_002869 [Epicoccum nigrum]|nr:hypothetical protein G6514_002869 [Epicoccum nigrum]
MCRVDERVYVRADGHRSVFQEDFMCEKGKQLRRICPDAKVRRTEYPDPTSSPIASSPITPNGPLYHARPRRPSTSSRPSTKDGPVASLKPEIHIEFSAKKGIQITTGKTKRSSGGSSSAYESPSSEASHTVRTGYPDISPPPLSRGGLRPSSGPYRNLSSDESHSGSSHVAHTYHTSDGYDTPSLATGTTSASSGGRPIIHNGPRHAPSPIDSTRGTAGSPSSPYRTAEVTPSSLYDEDSDRTRSTSSYAPEITGREADRQQRREQKKRQQEALDRELAANLIREENSKHVRFENDRANHRAQERAQNTFAAQEQRRAEDRERLRQQAAREREAQAAKEAASRRSKPPTTAPKPTRRNSVRMSSAEAAKQAQLVQAEQYQMQQERIKAEALEREERAAEGAAQQPPTFPHSQPPTLQQLQQDREYYNPRGTTRAPQPTAPTPQPPIIRRPSQSNQPRPDLTRRPSTREPSGAAQQPRTSRGKPPISYDRYNTNPARGGELPSARTERRPSSSHANNPFAPVVDPWDQRSVRDALPSARGPQVGHNFPPQQATQRMQQAVYSDPFSSSEEEEGGQGRYRTRR